MRPIRRARRECFRKGELPRAALTVHDGGLHLLRLDLNIVLCLPDLHKCLPAPPLLRHHLRLAFPSEILLELGDLEVELFDGLNVLTDMVVDVGDITRDHIGLIFVARST